MANGKMGKSAPMDSVKGLCSYSSNPMSQPSRTEPSCGPGMNSDQRKANKLMKKAHAEKEALRGKSGM